MATWKYQVMHIITLTTRLVVYFETAVETYVIMRNKIASRLYLTLTFCKAGVIGK